jgi:peptidoglycan/LPS O-acetylase OafA/YrhL
MTESTIPLSKSARQTRIPELDGLRGTAILLVAILHYVAVPGSRLQYFVLRFVSIGWTGVDLFFVLSGFLIGGILLDVRNSPSRFKTFYARRFFRIIPIYYTWILFYALIVIIGAFVPAVAETNVTRSPAQLMGIHSLFLQNIFFRLDGPLSDVWFRHTWSLAVEEQFYLVVPLLITLLSSRTLTKLLISIIVGAPLLRLATVFLAPGDVSSSWLTYTLTLCRADALTCGVLAAILWRSARFLEWASKKTVALNAGFCVLLGGVFALWKWSPQPLSLGARTIGYTWMAVFYTVLLFLVLLQRASPLARCARAAWLRELGSISYCVYIIHRAVLLFTFKLVLHKTPSLFNWRDAAVTMLAVLLTYALAKLSWLYLEQPLMQLGHAFKYHTARNVLSRPETAL